MDTIHFSAFRENLESYMNRVIENHAPLVIHRYKNRSVVLMSLKDFQDYEETSYLLSTPANAQALQTSLEEAERGIKDY